MDMILELLKLYGSQLSAIGAAVAFISFKQNERQHFSGKNLKFTTNW